MRRGALLGATLMLLLPLLAWTQGNVSADASTPTVEHSVRFSLRRADVTDGGRMLVIHVTGSASRPLHLLDVRVTGDTPYDDSQVQLSAAYPNAYRSPYRPLRKMSGDRTSGVWRAQIPLHRRLPQDRYDVTLRWLVGHTEVWNRVSRTIRVTDGHPDVLAPVLVSMDRPAEGATLSRSAQPEVTLHLNDVGSGVGLVWVCYADADDTTKAACDPPHLVSGTIHDGTWTTKLTHLDLLSNGPAYFWITAYDQVTLASDWTPADHCGCPRLIPDGRGDVTLID